MEFIGIEVCNNGNCLPMSKHELLTHWPAFTKARDIASFIGLLNFYSCFVPYFEQRVVPLHALSNQNMDTPVSALTDPQAKSCVVMIVFASTPALLVWN